MAEAPELAAALLEAEQAVERAQLDLEQTQRQQRELRLLVRQIETELEQLGPRKADREDRVRVLEMNASAVPPEDMREAYAQLSEINIRHYLMQTQLDTLRQREQWLGTQQTQLERTLGLLSRLRQALAAAARAAGRPSAPGQLGLDLPPEELARQVVAAREDLGRRLAQLLQDGTVQVLTNLVLQSEVCGRLMDRDVERARAELQQLKSVLSAALAHTRRFVTDLHPPTLEEIGLRPVLRRYLDDTGKRAGVQVRLEAPGQELRLPLLAEVALFRIIQESVEFSLANFNPSIVALRLAEEDGVLHLLLESDARPTSPNGAGRGPDFDVVGTYAQAIGGRVEVEGGPEEGLRLRLEVPLSDEHSEER